MLSQKEILNIFHYQRIDARDVVAIKSLGGGCSDHTYKITTDVGDYFLKYYSNQSSEIEAKGLELLGSTATVNIPTVHGYGSITKYNYLLLEWINSSVPKKNYWHQLGEEIAQLHGTTAAEYGLTYNNYIGRLHQTNTTHLNWISFFIENRLQAQIALANSIFDSSDYKRFDILFKKLPDLLPEETPSLIHGDLWSGNVMVNKAGEPVLIDPAVYYGHREIEIAFTKLFGGFGKEFYDSYNSSFPLERDFPQRIDLYNLYPLLVHVNMFGGGYITQVKEVLRRYTK